MHKNRLIVPADLLAQLEEREKSQQSPNSSDAAEITESEEFENPSVVALSACFVASGEAVLCGHSGQSGPARAKKKAELTPPLLPEALPVQIVLRATLHNQPGPAPLPRGLESLLPVPPPSVI
jgi:hypothetical protein